MSLIYEELVFCTEILQKFFRIELLKNDRVHGGCQVFVPVSEEQGGQMALLGQLMMGLILPSS